MAAQKALTGTAAALNGQEVRVFLLLECYEDNVGNLALEVVGQNMSSEVISLFLEDWEVGRVALSCHLSTDLFMPRNEGCVLGSSESLGFPRSLCSECQEGRRRCSDAHPGSFFQCEAWLAGWVQVLNMLCLLRNEGFLSFLCELPCFVYIRR